MENQTQKRRLLPYLIPAVIIVAGLLWSLLRPMIAPSNDLDALYTAAVADAMSINKNEVEPLVVIDKNSDLVTWNEAGDKVLMLSWHSDPQTYGEGATVTAGEGALWTFTAAEFESWYEKNKNQTTDWDIRLAQLIGLPADCGYTHMSGLWVSPDAIIRPANSTDITSAEMPLELPADVDATYANFYTNNVNYSYHQSAYPWTRLGYTYDWADNGTEYGLTEFLVVDGGQVDVAFTQTTADFLASLH